MRDRYGNLCRVPANLTSDQLISAPSSAPTYVADMAISPEDIKDDHGEWTILSPSGAEDTSASFCLTPGEYELVGSEGAYCFEGWGGGYVRVVDIAEAELLSYFTLPAGVGCTATAQLTVPEDNTLIKDRGLVLFERNRATGTTSGFCGAGCGGALCVGESSSADFDRVDFSKNSAGDGGAVFVNCQPAG